MWFSKWSAAIIQYEGFFILQLKQQPSQNVRRTFLEKKSSLQQISFVCFSGFARYLLKYNFVKLGFRKFDFSNYKMFFQSFFFFQARKVPFVCGFHFLKYKKSFILRQYKKLFWSFHFLKYKNSFLLRKYKKFSNITVILIFLDWIFFIFEAWAEKFHFLKYKKFLGFWFSEIWGIFYFF